MTEQKSETRIIWVVIILIGAQLLGIDLQQLPALLAGIQQHADAVGQAIPAVPGATGSGNITLPLLAGVYAWLRTDIKKQREKDNKN